MRLKKLKLENIRSYENLELEFPEGSILLSGDIGAGKTSVLLALQFALFGLQPGQKGASILRQGQTRASVLLELEVDSRKVVLERSLKQAKNLSITQDSNIITIDDQRQELSTSEMKNRVIKLLDYPKEFAKKSNLLYKFTVYTPQEEMKAIVQERPEIRLDTLRHVFGVDRYKRIKENSQIFIQKVKEAIKIKEIQVIELNILKEKLSNETEKKIQLSKQVNNLKIEFSELINQKNLAEQKLNSIKQLVEEKTRLDSEISKSKIELQGKKEIEQRHTKEISNMQVQISQKIEFSPEQLNSIIALIEKHKSTLDQDNLKFLEINSKISVLESKKEQAFQLKEKVSSLDNCPTCAQTVSQEHKERINKKTQFEIQDTERELEQKIFEKNTIIKEIEKSKQLIQEYEQDKNKLEQDKIKFEHQKTIDTKIKSDIFVLERTKTEINQIQTKISELELSLEQKFKQTEQEFETYKQQFDEINQKSHEKEIILAEKNKELELLMIQLQDLNQDITKKEKIRQHINYLRELQDWVQEKFLSIITLTENNVMAKLRSEFSNIFSEWFSMLVSDSLSVRLDENFTPIISNQDYEIDYDFLSGGERTAVALAYRLALNQVLNSLLSKIKTKGLVILDEPTDGFSAEQLDKMRDIFEQLKSEQTILVSHEQKIEGFVDHIIKIQKDQTSSIESVSS